MANRQGGARRSRLTGALVAGLGAALVLAGCGQSSGSGGSGGSGGSANEDASLRVAYPVGQTLDPNQASEPAQLVIATWPVYDRLLRVDPEKGYQPMLATKWEFINKGATLDLELRKGVTFSDGTKFDANAVKANLEAYMKAKPAITGLATAIIKQVKVVSPEKVEIDLLKPSTTILSTLASTQGGIMMSPKTLGSKSLTSKPVGTGAYVLKNFTPGQSITYERRTDKGGIWDPKTGKSKTVTITTMQGASILNAWKSGEIDVSPWSGTLAPLKSQIDSKSVVYAPFKNVNNMMAVYFNMAGKPFDDPKMRQAVNYAIDRDALVKAFTAGANKRVQPWPEGMDGFQSSLESTYDLDVAKAKALVKEAGHPNGVDAGTLVLPSNGGAFIPAVGQAIQSDLAKAGIKVKIEQQDVYSMVAGWSKSKSNLMLTYLSMPTIDPSMLHDRAFILPTWTRGTPNPKLVANRKGLDDPTMSDADRVKKIEESVDFATKEALYAPLWQGVGGLMVGKNVQGAEELASNVGGVADLRDVFIAG